MFKVRDLERVYIEQKKEVMYLNAKKYLQQLKWLKHLIDSKKEQLQSLRETSVSIQAIDYSKERVQSSGDADKISGSVAKILDVEREIQDDIFKFTELYDEINSKIQLLPELELKTVLIDKYMNMMTFESIAEKNDCSIRWVYELHQRALSAFTVVLKMS